MDGLPQVVWIIDASGAITFVNRRWTEFTGLSVEQSLGAGRVDDPDDLRQPVHEDSGRGE